MYESFPLHKCILQFDDNNEVCDSCINVFGDITLVSRHYCQCHRLDCFNVFDDVTVDVTVVVREHMRSCTAASLDQTCGR